MTRLSGQKWFLIPAANFIAGFATLEAIKEGVGLTVVILNFLIISLSLYQKVREIRDQKNNDNAKKDPLP